MEKIAPRTCLVTGATGVVGVPLVDELLNRGHRVRILARRETDPAAFRGPVEVVSGDINDDSSVDRAILGIDWIFHLAAKLHINDPGPEDHEEYNSVNVEGTRTLVSAAANAGVQKFVFFSTINVYGAGSPGKLFDETSELAPTGIYGRTKAAAEELVTSARDPEGRPIGVVLRLAAIYGSRMKGNFVRLARSIERGRFVFVGPGRNRRTVVHQHDAVAAAVLAAERAAGGSVYNVTDGKVHTLKEIVSAIGAALDRNAPGFYIPVAPVRLGTLLVESIAKTVGLAPPVSRDLLEKFLEDIAVDGTKMQRELGFSPQVDLSQGWREALRPEERATSF